MSTNWYFVCASHEPNLYLEDPVGGSGSAGAQSLSSVWRKRAVMFDYVDACTRENLDWDLESFASDDGRTGPAWFLLRHRNCVVVVESESGERYAPNTEELTPRRHLRTPGEKEYFDEGDEVWVKARVYRGGGSGHVTMVDITGFKNSRGDHFSAVFPDDQLLGYPRALPG